ncbi:MAG: glycyl radical protein [Planctomycetota bacterium]|jgi:formate C-acetyltransferase|nr:glycyl radical protein [Planctomycetota bacterium]
MTESNIRCEPGSARAYKRHVKSFRPTVCLERALLATESYRRTESLEPVLRRAHALRHVLENMTIHIHPGEALAGNQASRPFSAPLFPEYAIQWFENELDSIPNRPIDRFDLPEDARRSMEPVFDYWRGKTLYEKAKAAIPEVYHQAESIKAIFGEHLTNEGDGHLIVDYEMVLRSGLSSVRARAEIARLALDLRDPAQNHKRYFLEAVEIVCGAVESFALRFAVEANRLAEMESDPDRKARLEIMSRNCRRVPMEPARNFTEALQSLWFVQLILQIESNGHSISLGRFDQYLYPYFERDIAAGALTEGEALELVEHFWVKLNTINKIRPWTDTQFLTGYPMFQNVTIGGQVRNGRDAVNTLTHVCLKASEELMLAQPSLSARYHLQSSDEYLTACMRCVKTGIGMPAMFNDEAIIPSLLNHGVDYADAENYGLVGCVEVAVPGKWGYRCNGMSYFNMLKVYELAMNDGVDPATGLRLAPGAGTLAGFGSMSDVWQAWRTQLDWYTRCYIEHDAIVDSALETLLPDPFCSMLVKDCIARGLTIKEGGAVYDVVSAQSIGIANISNAMAAVKKLCFDDKTVSPAEMKLAVDGNFSGPDGERIRRMILESGPKYGNDDDAVDEIAVKLFTDYARVLKQYKNARWGRGPIDCGWQISTSTVTSNVPFGKGIGATTDGRKAGESLAEGCSPVQGTDRSGPTASMNTIAKLPNILISGGQLYNMKFAPAVFADGRGIAAMIALVRAYGMKKGWHVQFNVVNGDTLRDAQKRPEKYRDLVVRVAGYSAYFVDLDVVIQDDIIRRSEHALN